MKINLNIRETLKQYRRVLQITKKPDRQELKKTTRICGIGILVMGLIGFFFYLISIFLGGA